MRLVIKLVAAAIFFSTLTQAQEQPLQEETPEAQAFFADTIIHGGPIYTADDNNPTVEAIAIRNGRFIHVGNITDTQLLNGPETTVISLEGAALFPGFTDSHVHLAGIGQRALSLNLGDMPSLSALKEAVSMWRHNHPDDPLILAGGWDETHWPEKRTPSKWDLDDISNDSPILLFRTDGHALVANSKALALAGITSKTKSPYGGAILKNALGEITGVLLDKAQNLALQLIPPPTADQLSKQVLTGSQSTIKQGWTAVHNMSVSWPELETIEALSDAGTLKLRSYNSVSADNANRLFVSGPRQNENGKIITRAIKLMMDGALGSRGAALIEPYADADGAGLLLVQKEDIMPLLARALREGIQVNTHAIGDRANRLLLDWYEEAMEETPEQERAIAAPRWRDEHAQIINVADIERYAALGIIPSMQPSHAIGDLHFAPARLGEDRLRGAYAWSSLINSGVIIAGGSDAPVEKGSAVIEFYAATARRDLNGFQGEDWHAEEVLTREEALKMFTLWPAIASFQEQDLGSIAVGKKADLTAFDIDLMTAAESELPNGQAILTIIEGEIVYSAQ
ncbi:MAG: amidohydrolase [Kordiimonadaceae bacterium]|nr:amidohydrolase [Kordiimonadaceae bacterium]